MAETGRKKRLPELGRLNGRGFLSKSGFTKEGSPLKQSPGGSPKRPLSPAPNCSICLGGIEDQSFANKCFHSFCKTCLFEWSKVKPECPVCRQGFDSIIFNVKAMDDYEEYNIPRPPSPRRLWSVGAFISEAGRWETRDFGSFNILRHRVIHLQDMFDRGRATSTRDSANRSARRLSVYYALNPSTNNSTTTERTPPRAHESSSRSSGFHFDLSAYFRSLDHIEQRTPAIGTCAHRRYLYENDLWVQPITGRLERECSASFYRNNPAVTHRLLPFLNRELIAILRTDTESSQSTETLLSRIKSAIFEYDIPSIQFRRVVEPYINDKTHHFLHELFYFAKSPYTIEDYNNHAVYLPRAQVKMLKLETVVTRPFAVFTNQEQDSDSSTDDSVIEVVDSEHERNSTDNSNRMSSSAFAPVSASTSTPTIPATEATKSDCDQKELRKAIKQVQKVVKMMSSQANQEATQEAPSSLPQNVNVIEDFDNPRPGPSGLCRNNDFNPSNQKSTVAEDGSDTEIDVGTNENPSLKKKKYDSDSEDSDDSIKVVGYKKPIRDRTPEVINISSCGESDNGKKKMDDGSEDDYEDEPKRKKLKINFSSLFHPTGKPLKAENDDEKITDSEDSDNGRDKSSKKQMKRRRTRLSHTKRQRVSVNKKLNIGYDSSDLTSSDSDSEMSLNQRTCRRMPSVIVKPNKTTNTFTTANHSNSNSGNNDAVEY